jgi:hypothetical protein
MYFTQWNLGRWIKLLLALASIVIFGSEYHGIPHHILLPNGSVSIHTSDQWNLGNPN